MAFRQVMEEGKRWAETFSYQRILQSLKDGAILWGCRTKEEFDQRCRRMERLFHTIRKEGYKAQNEIHPPWLGRFRIDGDEEVGVSVGRHGDLLFCDGAHRLAIAKLLGVPSIPVEISVRHREWFAFRRALLDYRKKNGNLVDQSLPHPDLVHFPSRLDGEALFSLIRRNLSAKNGLLLDLNARFGFFCHRFEEEGFTCLAWEESGEYRYFLTRLRRAGNKSFRILEGTPGEKDEILATHFQTVLALNALGHPEMSPFHPIELLKKIHSREIFVLQPAPTNLYPHQSGKEDAPLAPMEFWGDFPSAKKWVSIGALADGTTVYKWSDK